MILKLKEEGMDPNLPQLIRELVHNAQKGRQRMGFTQYVRMSIFSLYKKLCVA